MIGKIKNTVKNVLFPCEKINKELRVLRYGAMERNAAAHERVRQVCSDVKSCAVAARIPSVFPELKERHVVNPR